MELMKQKQYSPMNFAEQAVVIFALNAGMLDAIPVTSIERCEEECLRYMHARESALISTILETKDVSGDVKIQLEKALKDFLSTFTA